MRDAAHTEPATRPHDFRNQSLLTPDRMRQLRAHQTRFLNTAAERLALSLHSDFSLKPGLIQIETCQKLADGWITPAHLILFKIEPLRGVSVLEIPIRLGLAMADRLMGGPGRAGQTAREISEIEKALLDQFALILLEEWCNHWAAAKPWKPALLGCETNGHFLHSAPPQTQMLTVALDASLDDCAGNIKLAIPHATLEPSLRQLCQETEPAQEKTAPPPPVRWNHNLDDITLPVTAEWQGLELSARDVLCLKVGDILQVNPRLATQVSLRLGDDSKLNGRLGTVAGRWAVKLTQAVKP